MLLLAWGQRPRRMGMKFLTGKQTKEGDGLREVRRKNVISVPLVSICAKFYFLKKKFLKGHSTYFKHDVQLTRHEEQY